jgi:RNA polymerase sigma-70 factor, ECF subfamily
MNMPIDSSAQDRADMERLASGHDTALNDLMERHGPKLYNFLYRMLGNEEDANDLAQETFVRVYTHRTSYNPTHSFTTWLFTIAANLARNQNRWRNRHPNVSMDAPLETGSGMEPQTLSHSLPSKTAPPDEEVLSQEQMAAVRAAVDELPEEMREVTMLCEWEDFSAAQVADILKINVRLCKTGSIAPVNNSALRSINGLTHEFPMQNTGNEARMKSWRGIADFLKLRRNTSLLLVALVLAGTVDYAMAPQFYCKKNGDFLYLFSVVMVTV